FSKRFRNPSSSEIRKLGSLPISDWPSTELTSRRASVLRSSLNRRTPYMIAKIASHRTIPARMRNGSMVLHPESCQNLHRHDIQQQHDDGEHDEMGEVDEICDPRVVVRLNKLNRTGDA